MQETARAVQASVAPPPHPRSASEGTRICVLIRPGALPGHPDYVAGAFVDRSAAEAVRATLSLIERSRAEIRELEIGELRRSPQEGERWAR